MMIVTMIMIIMMIVTMIMIIMMIVTMGLSLPVEKRKLVSRMI